MTNNEKMIWAAAFALSYVESTGDALSKAAQTVQHFRLRLRHGEEAWPSESDHSVINMAREMGYQDEKRW